MVDGKDFRLADEVRYVQRCAARLGRIVTIGQLILFSTETGDAWLLDKDDGLAAPLARDGVPNPSGTPQAPGWQFARAGRAVICASEPHRRDRRQLHHRMEGALPHRGRCVHLRGHQDGRDRAILGYPTQKLEHAAHGARGN